MHLHKKENINSKKENISVKNKDYEEYILRYDDFIFFGSAHISTKTKKVLRKIFQNEDISAVALELDFERLHALLEKRSQPRFKVYLKYGIIGLLFFILAKYQQNLAKKYKVLLGEEMITALKLTSEFNMGKNIKIFLIDQPIEKTLKDLKKALNFKAILRLIVDAFKKERLTLPNDFLDWDWEEVEKIENKIKERYSTIYKVLIEKRNIYMAKNLIKIKNFLDNDTKCLVIVGKAHVKGIIEYLKKLNTE